MSSSISKSCKTFLKACKHFCSLFVLNLIVKKRNFFEYLKIVYRYYFKFSFARLDLFFLMIYFFHNPFKISKRFLIQKGEKEIYGFGETPLTTFEKIVSLCQIEKHDKVFELGSGRGRCCFWLASFVGCQVVGVDYVPQFIKLSNRIKERFQLKNVEFREEDILDTSFNAGTVFYLYGTNLSEASIKKLIKKFKKLPSGTKIITVSYPLSDYDEENLFLLVKKFQGEYTWGKADLYFQIIR